MYCVEFNRKTSMLLFTFQIYWSLLNNLECVSPFLLFCIFVKFTFTLFLSSTLLNKISILKAFSNENEGGTYISSATFSLDYGWQIGIFECKKGTIWQGTIFFCLESIAWSGEIWFFQYSELIQKHCVVPLHSETIWSQWLSISPEVFLARWRTNPFICMACYTSLHLPQDWDCVLPNSWLMSYCEAVPAREAAHS